MPLTKTQSEIWQAMDIGPQWVERDKPESLLASPEKGVSVATAPQKEPDTQVVEPAPIARNPALTARVKSAAGDADKHKDSDKAPSGEDNTALQEKAKTASWEELSLLVSQCRACPMAATRKHCVFADGKPGCPIVIVGEAPGRDEDLEGVPFVGKSGQLLTRILECLKWRRGEDVAIVNVLKCRPPDNRDPKPEEMASCAAFLNRQLELLNPKVVILMGRFAIDRLLGTDAAVGRLRGKAHSVTVAGRTVPAVVTYHPSYLLRNPVDKEKSWQDFCLAKRLFVEGRS